MGTRADFYVGRGEQAEWLGSIAWDGHPKNFDGPILRASSEGGYRIAVKTELDGRDDATYPEQGWPWPWADSGTTDYAYAFEDGKVWASYFGADWFDPLGEAPDHDCEADHGAAVFPDMKDRQSVTFGERSGVILVRSRGVVEAD